MMTMALVSGAPDRIRTCGLRLRRPTLYPAELRAPFWNQRLTTTGAVVPAEIASRVLFVNEQRIAYT